MDAFGEGPREVIVGFSGGQAIALRVREKTYRKLRDALGSDRGDRWHDVDADGAEVAIDLSQVIYVRLDIQERRAGFRGG